MFSVEAWEAFSCSLDDKFCMMESWSIIMTIRSLAAAFVVAGRTSVRWSCPHWCCWTPWWRTTARAWTPSCWPLCSLSYRLSFPSQGRLTRHGFKNSVENAQTFLWNSFKSTPRLGNLFADQHWSQLRIRVSIYKSLRIRIRTQRAKSLSVRSGLRSWSKFAVPIKVVIFYCCFFRKLVIGAKTSVVDLDLDSTVPGHFCGHWKKYQCCQLL